MEIRDSLQRGLELVQEAPRTQLPKVITHSEMDFLVQGFFKVLSVTQINSFIQQAKLE